MRVSLKKVGRMKNIILASFVLIFYTTNLLSKEMNISDFDVAGIKLGMDPETVIQKLKSKYHLKDEDILILKNSAWGNTYKKDMNLSGVTVIKQANRGQNPDFHVGFCISEETHKSEVETVSYSIPGTEENKKKMYEMAIQKYGMPSISSVSGYTWCDKNQTVRLSRNYYVCKKENRDLHLTLYGSSISLYSNVCSRNNIKIREKRKNTSPNF